ncbi:MAG: CoA transferase [Gammaproteobacteria bacterium]|nr:CoA transferase [Gammaproteobacteria bacterium]MBM4238035.1 CoA transferase [Gammaproteobacteria bacterium]
MTATDGSSGPVSTGPLAAGPLATLKVIEFAGIGPAPYAGMLLADLGAEVIRIDRHDAGRMDPGHRVLGRGRRSIALNLKNPSALDVVRRLVTQSDALIEGFRPGVMERLSLGPRECAALNPRLVFGRVTGWGQQGPLAQAPGHDINYIALTGVLDAIGTRTSGPVVPLNVLGDFAGGGMLLAFGVLAAVIEARSSGRGQVVDAAMVDGASSLASLIWGMRSGGWWSGGRGENLLDGGAHFYGVFTCADGKWITLASIEPPFYAALLQVLELDPQLAATQMDARQWPELRAQVAAAVRRRTRDEWCALLEGSDVCFAPVLDFDEARQHPHNRAREAFMEQEGLVHPAAAPRFSATPARAATPASVPGAEGVQVLQKLGFAESQIAELAASGAVRLPN